MIQVEQLSTIAMTFSTRLILVLKQETLPIHYLISSESQHGYFNK